MSSTARIGIVSSPSFWGPPKSFDVAGPCRRFVDSGARQLRWFASVGQGGINLQRARAIRLKRDMFFVGSPCGLFVISRILCQLSVPASRQIMNIDVEASAGFLP